LPVPSTVDYVPAAITAAPEASATVIGRWRRPLLVLVAFELAVVFTPTVAWLLDRWTLSVWHNAHGMFVPPLAAWLAWQELKAHPNVPAGSSRWGYALLVPALALHALDAGMHTQLLSAVALFVAIAGLALLTLGTARTRLIAFPLAFLVFAIPIPLALTEPLHLVLRQFAAAGSAALLPALGVSVFREGTVLHTAVGPVTIVDACSGFSTLYASVAVATLAAYGATGWGRRALVFLSVAPIALGANLLRVLVLILLVLWYGWGVLDTFIHPLSGMVTFALALPLIFWLGGPARRPA
jgi:exosortase